METFTLSAKPALFALGPNGRAVVLASVPFTWGTTRHCANELHVIDGGRRNEAVLQALNPTREGTIRVWKK